MVAARRIGEIVVEEFGWAPATIEQAVAKQHEKHLPLGSILRSIGPPDEVALALGIQNRERRQTEEARRRIADALEGFSAIDVALMEMTNSPVLGASRDPFQVITTKQAYPWASLVALLFDELGLQTTDEQIAAATRRAMNRNADDLHALYFPDRGKGRAPRHGAPRDLSRNLMRDVCNELGIDEKRCDTIVSNALRTCDPSVASLARRGLLSDPISLLTAGGGLIAFLGFVPIAITTLTVQGELRYTRIRAVLMEIESWKTPYLHRVDVRFRVWKAVRVLRRKMIEATEGLFDGLEELASESPTPETILPPDPRDKGTIVPHRPTEHPPKPPGKRTEDPGPGA